jgi:Flp pilus assembly protein TadG
LTGRRARWKDEEGAVLVEFAIVMPILLLIVWCIVDFARAYYTVNSLATAVREGARYAAVQIIPGTAPALDSVRNRTKAAFRALSSADSLKNGQINVLDSTLSKGNVTVQVTNYWWKPSAPFIRFILPPPRDSIMLTRKSTFRWERAPTS